MNFYELKSLLMFPRLAGAIRRKSDVAALLQLNKERAGRYWDLAMLVDLNSNKRDRPYEDEVCAALMDLHHMHMHDVNTLQKYLDEHKMGE